MPISYRQGGRKVASSREKRGVAFDGPRSMFTEARNVRITGGIFTVAGGVEYQHSEHAVGSGGSGNPTISLGAVFHAVPNFRDIYQDILSKATAGTGMWLFKSEKFQVWLDRNGSIQILWGSGMPGAGKTMLASLVIQKLEKIRQALKRDGPICVCFIYFRYSDHSSITVKRVLQIILKQTLERHPECFALAEQTFAQHLRESTEPTEAQLLDLLREMTEGMAATFYVCDALDEAPVNIQISVLRALISLGAKLFVTSRPLKAVEGAFPEAHAFPIAAQDGDIELHVSKGINDSPGLLNLVRQEGSWLQDEIMNTMKDKASGMFLHVALQMDALRTCMSLHQVRKTLSQFPSQIEAVYLQSWQRILEGDEESVTLAKAVFAWVLNALRSLTMKELERAVATSPDTHKFEADRVVPASTLVALCRGLLIVEDETHRVRLVHYTAKDYLIRLLRSSFPNCHSLLANVCITHLIESGFQNTTVSTQEQFEIMLELDPLLAYASEAWDFHVRWSDDIDLIHQRALLFVRDSRAFPALTNFNGTLLFDILSPFHVVALCHLPLAFILDMQCSPDAITPINRHSPLIIACQGGNEGLVKHLLANSDIQVNFVSRQGCSALMTAIRSGHDHIAAHLLACPEIQVNLVDDEGWSELMMAAAQGRERVATLLLARPDIQLNLVDRRGWSALMLAAQGGHRGFVGLLLTFSEIQVNLVNGQGWSALMVAAYEGHEGVVSLLLAHTDCQVNLIDSEGVPALILAAHQGHHSITSLLLDDPKTQVNLVDKNGFSALMIAAQYGHEAVLSSILVHPQNQVNLADDKGWSALMVAAQCGNAPQVARILGHPEIQVNSVDSHAWSALMIATRYGQELVTSILLDHPDIQVNLVNKDGWSALLVAAAYGHKYTTTELLTHPDIKVNLVNNAGASALLLATAYGYEQVVAELLEHSDIDVNLTDSKGGPLS